MLGVIGRAYEFMSVFVLRDVKNSCEDPTMHRLNSAVHTNLMGKK